LLPEMVSYFLTQLERKTGITVKAPKIMAQEPDTLF
jgi:hypothetical protein